MFLIEKIIKIINEAPIKIQNNKLYEHRHTFFISYFNRNKYTNGKKKSLKGKKKNLLLFFLPRLKQRNKKTSLFCESTLIALSIQLVRFLLRNIASGSCTCEEQFQSCDSLRPIRTTFQG